MSYMQVNVAAMRIVNQTFPDIMHIGCNAHGLDLLIKDVCKDPWVEEILTTSREAVKFIKARNYPSELLKAKQGDKPLKLALPGATRFASNTIMVSRFLRVLPELQATVTDEKFCAWLKRLPNTPGVDGRRSDRAKGNAAKEAILDSLLHAKLQRFVKVLEPVVVVLRQCDSQEPCLGFIYPMMAQLQATCDTLDTVDPGEAGFLQRLRASVATRWDYTHTEMHTAAYVLNPFFYSSIRDMEDIPELMDGLQFVFSKLLTHAKAVLATQEFQLYVQGSGRFGKPAARAAMKEVHPHLWWNTWGHDTPNLQHVARRVTARSPASSCVETVWSNMDHLLGTKRTRLTDDRTFDLLYVYANGRAVRKLSQPIGHPQHAWLDIVEQYIHENESESECDDDDDAPQVADGVYGIESDDETL